MPKPPANPGERIFVFSGAGAHIYSQKVQPGVRDMPGMGMNGRTSRLLWQAGQALAMALAMQWRPGGLTAPVAVAWLCASLNGAGMPWGLMIGLTAGSLWAWPMQVQAAILPMAALAALLARPGGFRAPARMLLACALALLDAVTASNLNADAAPTWLLGALAALVGSILLIAAGDAERAAAPDAGQTPARSGGRIALAARRWPWRMRAFVGLAESASPAMRPDAGEPEGGIQGQPHRGGAAQADRPRADLRRLDGLAALAGRWAVHLAVAAGTAAAFGGIWGVLAAGISLASWREDGAMALAVLLAAVLAALGAPAAASASLCALWIGMNAMNQWGPAASALGGLAAAGLWLLAGGPQDSVWYLAALLPAGAVCALQPGRIPAARRLADARSGLEWQSRRMETRLTALSGVLEDMAQGYGSGLDPPREDELLVELRTRLCEGCARYERCWNGRAGEGTRLLCELITESVNGTLPGRATPAMMRLCGRADAIPDRLYGTLRKFAENRSAHMARMDGIQRAQLSISLAADMIQSMAGECAEDLRGDAAALRRLERALRGRGLRNVTALYISDRLALISPAGWSESDRRIALSACESVWGRRWCGSDSRSGTALILRPAANLTVSAGCDAVSMEENRNGDSVRIGALDDRRWMVAISDGMGVGAAAARESGRVVEVIERFLRAGLPLQRAAALANQMLLAEGRAEMFATLDLCVIDAWRREATFVKMAACDSFLLRGGGARVIAGGRLPMGILSEAAPQVTVMELEPGDVIVMGTDGAMDGLDRQTAAQCFSAHGMLDARALARALRQAGDEKRIHADDQTLAVIRIDDAAHRAERRKRTVDFGRMAADARRAVAAIRP